MTLSLDPAELVTLLIGSTSHLNPEILLWTVMSWSMFRFDIPVVPDISDESYLGVAGGHWRNNLRFWSQGQPVLHNCCLNLCPWLSHTAKQHRQKQFEHHDSGVQLTAKIKMQRTFADQYLYSCPPSYQVPKSVFMVKVCGNSPTWINMNICQFREKGPTSVCKMKLTCVKLMQALGAHWPLKSN